MRSGQWVVGIECVIEGDWGPVCRAMASGAGGGETGSHVRGVGRSREVFLMASIAGRGQRCEVVIGVALKAWSCGMRTGKRE